MKKEPVEYRPKPPLPSKRRKVTRVNKTKIEDDFYWLREKSSNEVKKYLEAENKYSELMMRPSEPLQRKLYTEILDRVKETDADVPYLLRKFKYYSRTKKGFQYKSYHRKSIKLNSTEQLLLDLNSMAQGKNYLALGFMSVSPQETVLAFSLDNSGFREFTLYFKYLESNKMIKYKVRGIRSFAWAKDGTNFIYVTENEEKRASKVWRGSLEDITFKELIYEEQDPLFSVSVELSKSNQFIFLTSGSATTSEVRYIRLEDLSYSPCLFCERRPGIEYYLDHRRDSFFRVGNSLTFCRVAHFALVVFYKSYDRRRRSTSFAVRNYNGLVALHYRNTRVCCS